ncbi:YeeE/YedE thiosulfate transporter family protein [Lachnoclostridium sp.]|uniref:YeeE/YedE thiosulfate transporter family protein n=1 Tax=Lachnoclostridium sp. TaxID=2028282 RepID=UPI002F3E1FB5
MKRGVKMKSKNWIVKALVLGTVFFLAALIVKPVGVSTQFSVLSGIIHSAIDPEVISEDDTRESGYISSNAYYDKSEGKLAKDIKNPLNYDFIFVLAIPIGAFIAYLVTKKQNKKEFDDTIDMIEIPEMPKQKQNQAKLYVPSFIGGFLLLYGARMADGCTSGHMMSGMMQGSVSGYIFAAAVFAVAIPTAIFIGMRYNLKGGAK